MDYEQEYINNDEFKEFVESKKNGLINKNNELLGKLKEANGNFEQLTLQFNELKERNSNIEQTYIKQNAEKMLGTKIFEPNRNLFESYVLNNITIDENMNLKPKTENKSIEEFFNDFRNSDYGKSCIVAPAGRIVVFGSEPKGVNSNFIYDNGNRFESMSTLQIAKELQKGRI